MVIPASTKVWNEAMDPYDVLDYQIALGPLLDVGEGIASYAINVLPEAQSYGLTLGTGSRAPRLNGTNLTIWLSKLSGTTHICNGYTISNRDNRFNSTAT